MGERVHSQHRVWVRSSPAEVMRKNWSPLPVLNSTVDLDVAVGASPGIVREIPTLGGADGSDKPQKNHHAAAGPSDRRSNAEEPVTRLHSATGKDLRCLRGAYRVDKLESPAARGSQGSDLIGGLIAIEGNG